MGKKFQKQQEKISQYIFDDYLFNRDFSSTDKVLKSTSLLIENNLASKISGSEYLSDIGKFFNNINN